MKYIEGVVFKEHAVFGSDTTVQFCEFLNGATLRGNRNVFRLNDVWDGETALTIYGEMNNVVMNNIHSFCIDGIRILNSYNAVTDNMISGSYLSSPDNHNDGIQIFSDYKRDDTEIHGINVSRNRLLLSGSEVSTQGIIATDCTVTDSIFNDNYIDVNHWHGITLNRSENVDISNNVILNRYGDDPSRRPWIKLLEDLGGSTIEQNTVPTIVPPDYPENRLHCLLTEV